MLLCHCLLGSDSDDTLTNDQKCPNMAGARATGEIVQSSESVKVTESSVSQSYRDADCARRNPRFDVPLVTSEFPRLPTRYRAQY